MSSNSPSYRVLECINAKTSSTLGLDWAMLGRVMESQNSSEELFDSEEFSVVSFEFVFT